MATAFATRLPFLMAAALVAAALGDPFVETVSNSGVFGGHYADDNHRSIVPTLLVALMLVAVCVATRCVDLCRRPERRSRDWLVDLATHVSSGSSRRDLPTVFAIQLLALFVMENAEQLLLGGKFVGGTVWLGGPVLFSLLAHGLIGAACLVLLRRFLRALLATFASLVGIAIEFVLLVRAFGASGAFHSRSRRDESTARRSQSPHARQIGERAPPFAPAFA